jgi:hypothetical protein
MGYRSNVCLAIAFKNSDQMIAFVTEVRLGGDEEKITALNEFQVTAERVLFYSANNVKWYDESDDVKAFEGFLRTAKERDLATCRIIVGEDYEDCVCDFVIGDDDILYELFSLNRSISSPSDGVALKHVMMKKKNDNSNQSTIGPAQREPVDSAQV